MAEVPGLVILLAVGAVAVVLLLVAILVREARNPPRHTAAWAIARGRPCDPGDLGLAFEEWTLDRPDGTRLPVWEIARKGDVYPFPPAPASGRDRVAGAKKGKRHLFLTVVFLHGWGRSRREMLGRIAPWDKIADRLVLYDLRGHGEAEGGASRLGAGEGEDLLALLERLGDGPFVLVGHSMGGVIAIDAASEARPVASRIVGVVAHGTYDDFHRSLRGRLRVTGYPARPFTDLAMWWFRRRGLGHRSTHEAAARLRCPLLLVHGSDDQISPIEDAVRIAAAAPDAVLHRVEDAAHSDAVSRDEAGHERAIRAFVDRIVPAPSSRPGSEPNG